MPSVATAFAPACVGNVAVGFDILGHSIDGLGDTVRVRRIDAPEVVVENVHGVVDDLPRDARNTAVAALQALRAAHGVGHGYAVSIGKGIPLASGMAGSAASAVAAVIAANALLPAPLPVEMLFEHALTGESVASGGRNGDNVGPLLLGGLVLAAHGKLVPIAVPEGWRCVLVHPHAHVLTKVARERLREPFALATVIEQTANLALVLAGCQRGDAALVRAGLADALAEPRRADLVPGFAAVQQAARDAGALGCSLSGAGPSLFAWFADARAAHVGAAAMRAAFADAGLASDAWISPIAGPAARVLEVA